MQPTKLWQTGHALDRRIEAFTVGDDFIIDERFLAYDLTASLAHARMLLAIGVLSESEFAQAEEGLGRIGELFASGEFHIERSEEDCHTAIEGFLTREYGDVGKKIHTGRSRNDQSLTMIRLFLRDALETAWTTTADLATALGARSVDPTPMPGYTHMQRAMPTTIGKWFGSYHQAVLDQASCFDPLRVLFDQSPLGSAAGFGIDGFPADRAMTARLMGFSRVQENPMYCGLSRGLFEHDFLGVLGGILLVVARMNNDILLFTTGEFGFFFLPDDMTTGSSIMPQKRNYDVCELVRAKISMFFGYADQMRNLSTHLIGGYQRDLQMTKSILLRAWDLWLEIVEIVTLVATELRPRSDRLEAAMTPDLFATARVYELVSAGMGFRDAYRTIKQQEAGTQSE